MFSQLKAWGREFAFPESIRNLVQIVVQEMKNLQKTFIETISMAQLS